jgi:putative acetyltransferase
VTIKAEGAAHRDAIAALHRAAFGGDFEAGLVQRLHDDGLVAVSLVALEGADVIGHILFSTLDVEVDGRGVKAVALAPLAVRPDHQRQGIGARLIDAGIAQLRAQDWAAVIVLGHPAYYARFGFSAALARKLRSPYAGAAFMALELESGALDGEAGSVRHPAAFAP